MSRRPIKLRCVTNRCKTNAMPGERRCRRHNAEYNRAQVRKYARITKVRVP